MTMVGFRPGDSDTGIFGKKKIRAVLPTGVEPMTFRLVLRMLYH